MLQESSQTFVGLALYYICMHVTGRSLLTFSTDESDRTCISCLRRSPRLRLHQHLLVPAFTLLRDYAARLRDPFDYWSPLRSFRLLKSSEFLPSASSLINVANTWNSLNSCIINIFSTFINRPGVAWAVLQTPSLVGWSFCSESSRHLHTQTIRAKDLKF